MSKLKLIILILLLSSLISCASYTAKQGFARISVEDESKVETRYNLIMQKENEIKEEEKRVEEEKLQALEIEKEEIERREKEAEYINEINKLNEEIANNLEAYKTEIELLKSENETLSKQIVDIEASYAEKERLRVEAEEAELARIQEEERLKEEERLARERELEQEKLLEEEKQRRLEEERLQELARIEEEERLKEEERIKNEERIREENERRQKEEQLAAALERIREINAYPADLNNLKYPHIYKPKSESTLLDDSFTKLNILFLPLSGVDNESLSAVITSIKDASFDFIYVTGELENQVNLAKTLSMNCVTLKGGSIIFTPQIVKANENSAIFKLSENKIIELSVLGLDNSYIKTLNDVPAYLERVKESSANDLDRVKESLSELTREQVIYALTSTQPSSLDWNLFTPYSYRDEQRFEISDYLNESFTDTYRNTHFSEEVDPGITFDNGVIQERLDFLYSKGVIEVSSQAIALSGLTNQEVKCFALYATYLIP